MNWKELRQVVEEAQEYGGGMYFFIIDREIIEYMLCAYEQGYREEVERAILNHIESNVCLGTRNCLYKIICSIKEENRHGNKK